MMMGGLLAPTFLMPLCHLLHGLPEDTVMLHAAVIMPDQESGIDVVRPPSF